MSNSSQEAEILLKGRAARRAVTCLYYNIDKSKVLYSVFMDNQQASIEWKKETMDVLKKRLSEALEQISIIEENL